MRNEISDVVRTPLGLEDVSRYPHLLAELARTKDWTMNQLEKLAGRNFLRVFKRVEKVQCWLNTLIMNGSVVRPLSTVH
jgi:membrane dipeptidase